MRIIFEPKAKGSYKERRVERAEKRERSRKRRFKERMHNQYGVA